LFCISAFAQFTDSVATSVSRTVTLTADEADFSISAGASLDTTQQQIAQVFTNAGVTNLNLVGTSLGQNYDYSTNPYTINTLVFYQFTFSVPSSGLIASAKIMEALRTAPPALLQSFQYSAALDASQATVDAMHATVLPQLFLDAQKKAQTLATAAGLKLGAVKGVNESYFASGSSGVSYISSSTTGTTTAGGFSGGGSSTQYTFSANVTYTVAQ
jgi:uncharacterized protein YggE